MVLRRLRFGGPTFEEMGLPDAVRRLADEHRGLILVTGPTGSGKTTTLASMIGYINETKPVHIVTIEDPIEVLHRDAWPRSTSARSATTRRTSTAALRAALRQDPDVILIGEMRDTETVRAAIQAAETGHLVLSTLHTVDATETVNRVIDFFPPYQQKQVRLALAGTLRGIICQRLVTTVDGGRTPTLEILVNNGRVAERIVDPERTSEIKEVSPTAHFYGMMTFDQSLLILLQEGKITTEAAFQAVSSRHDFELAMQQAGLACPSDPSGRRGRSSGTGSVRARSPRRARSREHRASDEPDLPGALRSRHDPRHASRAPGFERLDRDAAPPPAPFPSPTTIAPVMPGW